MTLTDVTLEMFALELEAPPTSTSAVTSVTSAGAGESTRRKYYMSN